MTRTQKSSETGCTENVAFKTKRFSPFFMLAGIAWVAGLLLAGSDSPYMPWANGGGILIFLGASRVLARCRVLPETATPVPGQEKRPPCSGTSGRIRQSPCTPDAPRVYFGADPFLPPMA